MQAYQNCLFNMPKAMPAYCACPYTVRTNELRVRMSYGTQLTAVLGRDIHGTVLRPSRLVPAYLSVRKIRQLFRLPVFA